MPKKRTRTKTDSESASRILRTIPHPEAFLFFTDRSIEITAKSKLPLAAQSTFQDMISRKSPWSSREADSDFSSR